jgi:hypothetical protein
MKRLFLWTFLVCLIVFPVALAPAQQASAPADFSPDPAAVLRYGKGYRFPQAGWIVVHVEGEPYERGYQQGRLLPAEIAGYLRCFAQVMNYKAPEEGWKTMRMFANALFLRKFDKEFLEEMKGIADGASAAGARFDGRPIDLVDIAALNCWSEIESLDEANRATPTGLETSIFPKGQPDAKPLARAEHCSAFAATGPATADGKIVFGHITMFPLYPANFYNIWLDVKPSTGHRFVMCTYPSGIYSGMDYYINDAGILLNETTISQTRFNMDGLTCASRTRKAIQYGDSIDKVIDYFVKENNGLYTNEWMIGDINTNEIAILELGTFKYKIRRSSKNEWFGNTPGFYWGCNNTKDMNVRLETVASEKGRPEKVVFIPQERDVMWQKLYEKNKGKIGVEFAKEAFTNKTIAAPSSLDAKFTTTDMAKQLKSWALFGPPTGKTWSPKEQDKTRYPEVKALKSNPWTVLGITPPPSDVGKEAPVLVAKEAGIAKGKGKQGGKAAGILAPAWRGTLLPKTDADIWLAIAFADYQPIVAKEREAVAKGQTVEDSRAAMEKTMEVFKKQFEAAKLDVPLAKLKSNTKTKDWYQMASAKGVLLLNSLRQDVGKVIFDKTMDEFGMAHGGQAVTSKEFQEAFEQAAGRPMREFWDMWLLETGLPEGCLQR